MLLHDRKPFFSMNNLPRKTILFIILVYLATMFSYHNWTRTKPENRGVIHWDIISYYAYLPATFIYGDIKLGFLDDPAFKNDNKFWDVRAENGNRLIQTSMGMSFLYAPFFFLAHLLAPVVGEPRDGFGSIYQLFLCLSSLFYFIIGIIVLSKLLLRYFTPVVTSLTLLCIALGTNLFFYTVFEGPMTHSYNFMMITLFLYLVIKWYEQPGYFRSFWLGLLFGLIVLVRPTNILVIFLLFFWGVGSWKDRKARYRCFISHFPVVLLMVLAFIMVWIPQMMYWKILTGKLFYNGYSSLGGGFYFDAPHTWKMLFSYRKGWYLYTPLMLVATLGIIPLYKRLNEAFAGVLIYLVIMVYVLSSWWSWWYGGSFGLRSMVDVYGIMALPLAVVIEGTMKRKKITKYALLFLFSFMVYLNVLQSWQYTKGALHYLGTTKGAYWSNFLRWKYNGRHWSMLSIPDFELARKSIYVYYNTGDDYTGLKKMNKNQAMERIREEVLTDKNLMHDIHRYANRNKILTDSVVTMVSESIYNYKKMH